MDNSRVCIGYSSYHRNSTNLGLTVLGVVPYTAIAVSYFTVVSPELYVCHKVQHVSDGV